MELQVPVSELMLALHPNDPENNKLLRKDFRDSLRLYLQTHIEAVNLDGRKWQLKVGEIKLAQVDPKERNTIQDLIIKIWLNPPTGSNTRQFILNYDVIMHQVVTHSALVSIRQDWETGIVAEHPADIGVIARDPRSNEIFPLTVSLENKGLWGGFWSMVGLGRKHIAEGTDHLLFLFTLLLAAPLIVEGRNWGKYGGTRYAFLRLLRIVTAFTIGHSITLLAGALDCFRFPAQPIEVLIAGSILVSALHAIRPLFPKREVLIAAGFGLIHGLAFAHTLADLELNATAMTLSILGFNLGIEIQQLLLLALIAPSLIVLSKQARLFQYVRLGGATFSVLAALGWIVERLTGQTNPVAESVEYIGAFGEYVILGLGLLALGSYFATTFNTAKTTNQQQWKLPI